VTAILYGLLVSIANSVWVTSAHVILFDPYLANHPEEAAMMALGHFADSPRVMMAITGPLIGVVSGLILGLFAFVAGKFVKEPQQESTAP
jgi:thiamine transporter ThiT